ncbi:response regulator [Agrobacterium tumefaciens]|uniref:response regulator n=1 Tax=Agrobacterium tumefaciens TaxID=358 RepID=UPI00097609FD|nr:hypothetical protein BV900_27400 [Agrobacterium tumefaciens]
MKTVLIVDDSITIRKMLHRALKRDYAILEASDGREALRVIQGIVPDAVVSDIHMPDVDGISFIASVRSDPRFKALPVLVLTTEDESEFKQRARAAGATAWLQKPFEDITVQKALKKMLG